MRGFKAETTLRRAMFTLVPPENGIQQTSTYPLTSTRTGSSSIRGPGGISCERVARERTKAETAAGERIERAHTEEEERSVKENRRRAVEKTPSTAATTQLFMAIFSIPCSAAETRRSKWFMAKVRAPNWREKSGRAMDGEDHAPRRPRSTHWQEQLGPVQRALLRGANSRSKLRR
jgi:hypothetical protein